MQFYCFYWRAMELVENLIRTNAYVNYAIPFSNITF